MRKFLIIAVLFGTLPFKSKCQKNKFEEQSDKMFFNIFTSKPDTSVYGFIDKYFPYITHRPKKSGTWTIYPPDSIPKIQYTTHSLGFKTHPVFKDKFSEGLLEIKSQEAVGYSPNISDMRVWFMFDTKPDAQIAFKHLCKMFDTLSVDRKIFIKNGNLVSEYMAGGPDKVEIIMTKNELFKNKYKILFRAYSFTYEN